MTDALKMSELQRTTIEFERQRHLANWLIKSRAHMAKPLSSGSGTTTTATHQQQQQQQNKTPIKSNKTNGVTQQQQQSQMFLLGKSSSSGGVVVSGGGGNLSLSNSPAFTSQTNLPLQIVTTQEGHKPKLRRFNSHDTSANMFSAVDWENARLARRNEVERQRYKMNSLSSGGDCSTGDSKGSKFSSESNPEPLPANVFLERYTLPRVVRINLLDKFIGHTTTTLDSTSSNDSTGSLTTTNKTNNNNNKLITTNTNGELYLLYRHLKNRKIYHGLNTKINNSNKKKGIKIPQEFQGYFSLVNDRGSPSATLYTTIVQLVRERVYKFLSVDSLTSYTETQNTDTYPAKSQYVKGTAKAGQIFKLLAVFQDGGQDGSNSVCQKEMTNSIGREKERGRYAQLLGENRQIVYVSLSAKGKFYEIEQSVPQILQKSSSLGKTQIPKELKTDCIHQITNIITNDTKFPINLRFISGTTNIVNGQLPDNITVQRISYENGLIVCPIEETENRTPLHLKKLIITSDMKLTKCYLGFENEQRMFSNQNVQNLLKFCQFNTDTFVRTIENELITITTATDTLTKQHQQQQNHKSDGGGGLKILRPLNFTKFLSSRNERNINPHEKEDSIIFLSKNDLENLEIQQQQQQKLLIKSDKQLQQQQSQDQQTITDKMKVFQPTKKKWFKNFKNGNGNNSNKLNSFNSLNLDINDKRGSVERYQDMSKLLQERFGDNNIVVNNNNNNNCNDDVDIDINNTFNTNTNKSNSSSSNNSNYNFNDINTNINRIQKSMSLQDVVDIKSLPINNNKKQQQQNKKYTRQSSNNNNNSYNNNDDDNNKPDLLKIQRLVHHANDDNENDVNKITNYIDDDDDDDDIVNDVQKHQHEHERHYKEYKHQQNNVDDSGDIDDDVDDDDDNELTNINNQQSFISKKLYTEFHVKTRQHSKSSSSLHQLLNFTVPQKMSVNEMKKKLIITPAITTTTPNANILLASSQDNLTTSSSLHHNQQNNGITVIECLNHPSQFFNDVKQLKINDFNIQNNDDDDDDDDDDLPYSNVRDSLLTEEININNKNSYDIDQMQCENIYAEICGDSNLFENGLFMNPNQVTSASSTSAASKLEKTPKLPTTKNRPSLNKQNKQQYLHESQHSIAGQNIQLGHNIHLGHNIQLGHNLHHHHGHAKQQQQHGIRISISNNNNHENNDHISNNLIQKKFIGANNTNTNTNTNTNLISDDNIYNTIK